MGDKPGYWDVDRCAWVGVEPSYVGPPPVAPPPAPSPVTSEPVVPGQRATEPAPVGD